MLNKEVKEYLIENGVDQNLFGMPAIVERLPFELSKDDITINEDGTFNFENYKIEKAELDGKEVITIVECFEKTHSKNAALDAPFSVDNDYEPTFKELAAKLTIVDSDGIELEEQEIDNSAFLKEKDITYKTFLENPDLISEKYVRKNGFIECYRKGNFSTATERVNARYYDHGNWTIENKKYIGGSQDKAIKDEKYAGVISDDASPRIAIKKFDLNTERLLKLYPHLKENTEKRKEELIIGISNKVQSLISENNQLKDNNEKLQKMLQKSLTFAQTVRDSAVGKLFFGRKAKELLGEQDKDAKELTEGR